MDVAAKHDKASVQQPSDLARRLLLIWPSFCLFGQIASALYVFGQPLLAKHERASSNTKEQLVLSCLATAKPAEGS